MPSGAKKRKAAKKRKEKGVSNNTHNPNSTSSSTLPHGDEDLKHQESDGGEASDHHNSEHHLSEGEEDEVERKKEDNSRVNDVKNDGEVERRAAVEEGVVQIEKESKQEDEFDKKKGGFSKSSSSNSSNSSDDEPHAKVKDVPDMDSAQVVDSVFENLVERVSASEEKVLGDSGTSVVRISDLENGERKLGSLEVDDGLPALVKNLAPGNRKDEGTNAAATSEAEESGQHESEEKLTVSYNALRDDATKDAEHVRDSEAVGFSERQPLVASVVQPVQRTSWKACCGLFELFTGSNA